jgi:pyruvate formate lyase activating enzyme
VLGGGVSIKGFIKTSFLDWPGKVCSVVFLGGCGFRCLACHNPQLVLNPGSIPDFPLEEILRYLDQRRGWIDGVTVTGGEPTSDRQLHALLRTFRSLDLKIKLDTNGSRPDVLEELMRNDLIDAVFMDVKAPLTSEEYSRVAGVPVNVGVIRRSIDILKRSFVEVRFRTTVVPGLVEEAELALIAKALGDVEHFAIQAFRNVETLDHSLTQIEEFNPSRVDAMRRQFEIPSPETARTRHYSLSRTAA